jgi:hypothetical protein
MKIDEVIDPRETRHDFWTSWPSTSRDSTPVDGAAARCVALRLVSDVPVR